MRIVLDINVLLVSISPKSDYRWIFDNLVEEKFRLCVTTDILMEYEEIIGNHMGKEAATTVLQILENAPNVDFIQKYFKWNLIKADPDDNKFVDCAIASNASYIVTHDSHFKELEKIDFPKVEILSAQEWSVFLEKEVGK
ncbi:MAG: putative toxin-antitoxin system toxin component, PIN family [Saprospirales bacterium]|nr:putative toxin-antitoxin system toxin component, PIN family [Saprospirales bacterium]